jgi:hypothetical protein
MTKQPTYNLDDLLTIIYITLDDLPTEMIEDRDGRPPLVSDAELVCLSIAQALLDIPTERRFFRMAQGRLGHLFPRLPERSVYNKRLRGLHGYLAIAWELINRLSEAGLEQLRLVDSTAINMAASPLTTKRSAHGIYAEYGKKSTHKGFFWGYRLHAIVSVEGAILAFELTGGSTKHERPTLTRLLEELDESGQLILADKGYISKPLAQLARELGAELVIAGKQASGKGQGTDAYRGLRQPIELVFGSLKSQFSLERLQAKTPAGLLARILQRLLAYTAAGYCNWMQGIPRRSFIAYDH